MENAIDEFPPVGSNLCRSEMPTISIVTICKNAGATIERTLASVTACDYPLLQYVVVDGGSTDDTLEHVKRFSSRIDKFVSERDSGISDALNKAVSLSSGAFHLVVHADDTLVPESVSLLAAAAASSTARVVSGTAEVHGTNGLIKRFRPEPAKLCSKMSVPHMGSLIRKDAWVEAGGYDLRRKIAMDHLLMLRILQRHGVSAFLIVDAIVARYNLGGVSDRERDRGFREVRDNLIESGVGVLRSNASYARLLLTARISRLIRQ